MSKCRDRYSMAMIAVKYCCAPEHLHFSAFSL